MLIIEGGEIIHIAKNIHQIYFKISHQKFELFIRLKGIISKQLKNLIFRTKMSAKQSMSITQALPELKLLDKRMQKIINDVERWVTIRHTNAPVDVEKHRKETEAAFQSHQDLVKRRDAIKKAIVISNAVTRVKVGTWEGTVAEAIEYKNSIKYKQYLVERMRETLMEKRSEYERLKEQVDGRLERLLTSELGKDVKTNPETITALTNTFRENNKVELVDPLDLSKRVTEMEEEIDSFVTNVDWVLSESNGKTMIEV